MKTRIRQKKRSPPVRLRRKYNQQARLVALVALNQRREQRELRARKESGEALKGTLLDSKEYRKAGGSLVRGPLKGARILLNGRLLCWLHATIAESSPGGRSNDEKRGGDT